MASTTSKSEGIPTPPTFSYAQAAKGRVTSTATSAMQSSQASTSGISTPAKEPNSSTNTPSASVNGAAVSENGDRNINGVSEALSKADPLGVGMISDSKLTSQVTEGSIPVSPSVGTASTTTIPKDEELALDGTASTSDSAWVKVPRNTTDKPAEATEGRRNKKTKKQKIAEKEAAEKQEKEQREEEAKLERELLVSAPPPTVNIWQQRKEAQAAKTKTSPSIPQTSNAFTEVAAPTNTKPDARKKVKSEEEKAIGGAQTGKDAIASNKSQKKNADGLAKAKDELTKRPARGSRSSEKEEKPTNNYVPPPVEDPTAWPTPETAIEEEKRKLQEKDKSEKEEKDEGASNKPRTKEKWVPVPYTPSVTFNTPLPSRGGRGRGGARLGRDGNGRGGHTSGNGAVSGEKIAGSATKPLESDEAAEKRGRGDSGVRSSSLPPNASKRLGSDEPSTRDPRKPLATPGSEKTRGGGNKTDAMSPTDARRQSIATQGDKDSQTLKGQAAFEGQFSGRSGFDRGQSKEQPREGRSERGRGGYRGSRGSHSNFPNGQHAFTNGHGTQIPAGFQGRPNSGPYSPPLQGSGPFNHPYSQAPNRGGGRGSSRSNSIPNAAMYPRGYPNGNQAMPPLQTMYDYVPMQPMSAMPFNSFVESQSLTVLSMVKMQLEYYFSIDNLCKDVYLRKHMDSQGFVFLTFVAGFKRIQSLTQEIDLLRYACQQSNEIELIKGEDGVDRVRRIDGWEQWVMASEDRDDSMKNNAGPTKLIRDAPLPAANHMGQMIMPGQDMVGSPAFPPSGNDFRYGNGAVHAPAVNGNGNHYHSDTPLSAAVPEFAPALPLNGNNMTSPDPLESETTFTDEEVENLNLVFAQPTRKASGSKPPKAPYHTSASRTFSNGSIDGRSISEEMYEGERQGRQLANGNHIQESSPEALRRSRSPMSFSSPSSRNSSAPTVMWVKDQRRQAPVSEYNTTEKYTTFRERALRSRETSQAGDIHPDMKLLYEFWAHFLCRNFNPNMYSEFRTLALEDGHNKSPAGMEQLVLYYDETLNNKKKTIHDILASHYIDVVKDDDSVVQKAAFTKLRASWRNGALDMKSRKKIDGLLGTELKEQLEH